MVRRRVPALLVFTAVLVSHGLWSCDEGYPRLGSPSQTCAGDCAAIALTTAEVEKILAQGVVEAQRLGVAATLAVVDHVGNVLAVYAMPNAAATIVVESGRDVTSGLENPALAGPSNPLESTAASISKAGTAAYLSSQGNAFSTRTASQIVQEHFNPGERFRAGGPLFGVQFSQLPCGDFVERDLGNRRGPRRLPLGFSADPGGLALYIWGVPVGGVGVEVDGVYDLDPNIMDFDVDLEERIAAAAASGFAAPVDRRADRISVDGRFLRYADDEFFVPAEAPPLVSLPGSLVEVAGFFEPAALRRGAMFQMPESGIVAVDFEGIPAEVLVDGMGQEKHPPTASTTPPPGPTGGGLTADEVRFLLREALLIAEAARAQIRRPAGSKARVSISVVDNGGNILGIVRGRDAPIFGIDVSLQKARTAAFFSREDAADALLDAPQQTFLGEMFLLGDYVDALRAFLGDPTALANGIAFSDRAGGNLSRPFFPDGIDGRPNGPLSRPFDDWSPFSTGLQLDLVAEKLQEFVLGENPMTCTAAGLEAIANGIQIFPGSVPIYRFDPGQEAFLIGGIGVSGDGVDQDDLIAFLGLHNAGLALGGAIGNAPPGIRADTISVQGVQLRYVSCPPSPFLGSSAQNVCEGK